jgi:branched-chain amino acid transport system substrate-binding protein
MRRFTPAVLAVAAVLAGCGDDGAGGDAGEPIKIGVNVELSGGGSVLGEAYVEAAKLRTRMLNEDGGILGRRVELVVRDNRSDQTEALTLTRELTERDDVVAAIGPGTTPTSLAAMGAILKSGVPTFSLGSGAAIVSPAAERPNVFKTTPEGDIAAGTIASDLAERGLTRVALLSTNNPYGDDGLEAMRRLGEQGELELVATEKFEEDDADTTPQLQRLLDADPQAIVVWAIPPGAPTVRRTAVEKLGIELPMYFDSGAGAELFIELAGKAADGARVSLPRSLVWDQVGDAALQEFGHAYTHEYGEMSGFAGYAWDSIGLLEEAIEKAGTTDAEPVIAALEQIRGYEGVSGTLDFSADRHAALSADDLVILEVRDGAWTLAERR